MPLDVHRVLQLKVRGVTGFLYTFGVTGTWLSFIFIILR